MVERKLKEVRIDYDYDGKWCYIDVGFDDGNHISVSREQIEAFTRIHKVAEDLREVERLRDELVQLFGEKTKIIFYKGAVNAY